MCSCKSAAPSVQDRSHARDDADGDLVGSMPVEAAIRRKYGFVLMVDYSRASSVLCSRAKPEGPAKLEVRAAKVEVKPVTFNDEKELVAERMRGYCEHKGIRVSSSVQYSPLANGVAERQQHARCYAIQTSRRSSGQRG